MIQLIKTVSAILFCLLLVTTAKAQVFRDSLSTIDNQKFAQYLTDLELYELAAQEYEALLFQEPNNKAFIRGLISSYRLSDNVAQLDRRLYNHQFDDEHLLQYYLDALMSNAYEIRAEDIFRSNEIIFSEKRKKEMRFKLSIAKKDWASAEQLFQFLTDDTQLKYSGLMIQLKQTKFKSPAIAGVLSALIPGTGRFYSHDYADGLISMIFIASSGYQSYRRFNKNGVKSVGGWIYGGIALGFYVSNVYGSIQSAKYYNNKKDQQLYDQAMAIINSSL